jgi:undecaprenyl-diphosphatase
MSSLLLRIGSYDERLLRALIARRRPLLDVFMRGVTRFADWPVAVLMTLLMLGGFVPGLEMVGVRIAWTLAVSHLFVQILKRIFSRERPRFEPGLNWLVTVPDRFSFPSGHATAGMSIALPLALALPGLAGPLVLALGVLVGLSRCYLGVHYPGDVAAGWALAVTTLAGVVLFGF